MIWFTHTSQKIKSCLLLLSFALFSLQLYSQSIGVTSPVSSGSYCAGTSISINFSITGTFSASNVFSAQISDVGGSFAGTPETIGTRTSTTAGPITCTLPSTLLTSGLYRFRVISSSPAINGSDNGANISVIGISLNAPTLSQTSLCQGETFTVNFSQSTCNFVNTPAANVYSVELSDAAGSFTSPVVIGTRTAVTAAVITCTLPSGTAAGTGYRIRITASSPATTGPDNGSNLTVMAAVGTPSVYGNGKWNVYCYNARNDYSNNYQGLYTENNLSFTTTARWSATGSPSSANAASGTAYLGCIFGNAGYSLSFKRTNIPCGYYQIDIPSHRTEVTLFINGVNVFQHLAGGDGHTNVWTGIISPSDNLEFQMSSASNGNLQVTFSKLNQLTMSVPVTICASSTASISVTNTGTVSLTYSWSPAASLNSSTASAVTATPAATTVYTVTGTDAGGTSCLLFANTVTVTVNPVPTTTTTIGSSTICSGFTTTTITATGANTYSWAPATGLSSTTGYSVTASPTVTTVYTVTGSNNCTTTASSRTVTVKTVPAAPSPTAFGSGVWNVYCYNGTTFSNYYGYYTENNLSFNSTNRWAASSSPSVAATTTAGTGYSGCNLVNAGHSTISKRTNFTCGYYRIDMSHDDYVTLLINNSTVFTHTNSTGDTDIGTWTGFLGPSSTVEIRHSNASGNSFITATFVIVPVPALSPPVTICAGTSATLTAANISGVSYSWAPTTSLSATTGTISISSTTVSTNYTCTIQDAATSCTASSTTSVTVNSAPTTTISATASTINCQAQTYTLIASGANTYTWSPATGLSSSSGYSVVASPTVNTIYTVTGNNNCSALSATTNVIVVPLVNPTVYPTGTWNAYGYASTTFTNYYGYYTENGTGTSGYDFNTATRWASGASPSTTNTSSGLAYQGCTMPATNWSMSFKRTGFACNTYSIVLNSNDETATIFINGSQVASRGSSAVSVVAWVGVLSASTTVEIRLVQTTGTSGLSVSFTPAASSPARSIWCGATSNNWYTASNWCGSAVPTSTSDVIIYTTGALFQPSIGVAGAVCNDLTISAAIAASGGTTTAIPAATLTMGSSSDIDVHGDWLNYGTFVPGTGTVNILGSGSKSITATATQTFNCLTINNTGSLTMSGVIHKINSQLDLTSGIIALSGTLHILNAATVINASDASYVEGAIVKFGNQAFTFPVGLNGIYRPISISAPVSTTDNFTAQYFYTSPSPPYTSTSKDASIHHISACEYWLLNRTGGSSIVYVTLSWDSNSCGVDNLPDLLVARWDAGQVKWKDHGNGAVTGNTLTGTVISSAPVSVFSPFTLGSKTALNVLPVELTHFSASCSSNGVIVKWTVASETNNEHFILERSTDGIHWQEAQKIKSLGNTRSQRNYSMLDRYFSDEVVYYRLSQVDVSQDKKTFKIISNQCGARPEEFRFYPNPASNELSLFFNSSQNRNQLPVSILNNLGQPLLNKQFDIKKGDNIFLIPLSLPPGIYFITYSSATGREVHKLIIQ